MRALGLLAVLLLVKVLVIVTGTVVSWSALAFVWQDVGLVLVFALVERAIDGWLRRPRLAWCLYFAIVVFTALNLAVVQVLSTPLTWSMVHATDAALVDSIAHHLGWRTIALPAVVCGAALVPLWCRGGPGSRRVTRIALLGGAVLVLVGPLLTGRVTAARPCNAVLALLASALPRLEAIPTAPRDWRADVGFSAGESTAADVPAKESAADIPATESAADAAGAFADVAGAFAGYAGAARGHHVVLVILESVGARYLAPYGADEDPMPNLTELAERAVLFENAYAVYPESIKGLVALQFSLHPAMDTRPQHYRAPPVPALGAVLDAAGYATGLFHSGRFEYLGMAEVIANGGYHVAVDAGGIGGKHESSFGVEESATVARMLAWVDETRGRPFFLTYMPVAGHHPYDAPEPGPFDSRRVIGSYRNAIHAADRSIGTLVAGLRARGLWEHTVFVVVGDHGQAFGQHPDNFGHTFFLYEENVHVPFLIAAPGLVTRALRVCQVTSHVDVAPTILGLVGVNPPRGYEGFDMLRPRRALALMFTDYAEAFVGLRDGRFKFIHHVEAGTSALFDLIADPGELHDIASSHGARVAAYRERALAWAASRRGAVMSW